MRRSIRLAANLYPHRWRERYGVEFEALLEDINPGWREFTDVLRGALTMQMTNATTYLKLAGGLAVAGAIVAIVVSFIMPGRYVSSAVIQMTARQDPQRPVSKDALDNRLALQLGAFEQERLSRTSLEDMIRSLDLYKSQRQRMPMEDVAEQMRRDLKFHWKTRSSPYAGEPAWALSISFAYPDKEKARSVVDRMVTGFAEENRLINRYRGLVWQKIWSAPAPPGQTVEILQQASLPESPTTPNRLAFVPYGLGAGMLLGLLTAFVVRRPK
jgi:LPS O-antigen subunit length determinant protein (WzzB/FepE family)